MGKIKRDISFIIVLIFISIHTPQFLFSQQLNDKDKNDILSVLKTQETKWNEGDIQGYMEGYLHSDSLQFITKKGVTYGWNHTLEKYKKSYPDKAAMGYLQFDVIDIGAICENKAIMNGKWTLTTSASNDIKNVIIGYFTLIWQKINGRWYIIIDHTS